MPQITAKVSCPVHRSFRVEQVAGMFDLKVEQKAVEQFTVELPDESEEWDIGLIVGPSGSGKSTIAREAYGDQIYSGSDWPSDKAVVDCFGELPIQGITHTLTSVGFSSPPAWLKPYGVLSNGEKFRCDLARALLSDSNPVIFDEFTSVVDRTVAQIGSAAVAKAIRSGKLKRRFVAVTCHYDVAEWLQPDWVLDMATKTLARGRLRRPPIQIEVFRCDRSAWELFKRHHYLSSSLVSTAACFMATINGQPAAFCAAAHHFGKRKAGERILRRISRIVTLPDFQGVGVGGVLMASVAAMYAGMGERCTITSSHPAVMRSLSRNPSWRMSRKPSRAKLSGGDRVLMNGLGRLASAKSVATARSTDRLTASFEYVGPAMAADEAARLNAMDVQKPQPKARRRKPKSRRRLGR